MTLTQTPKAIFEDAQSLYEAALSQLQAEDIRDAAEKAWCATKRATEALILAYTGELPHTSAQTSSGLRRLSHDNPSMKPLPTHYGAAARFLHGDCFYDGHCEPLDDTRELIMQAGDYIREAQGFAADAKPD